MKIIQTNKAYYPKVGGIESTVTALSEGLISDFNADVKVLVCNDKIALKSLKKNINGVEINYLPTYGFISSLPISPGYFTAISKLAGDILHIHEPFPLADISLLVQQKIRKNFSKIVVSWHSDIIRQKWVLRFYSPYLLKFLNVVDKITVSNPELIDNSEFLSRFRDKCVVIPHGIKLDWVDARSLIEQKDNFSIHNNQLFILFVGRLVYYKGIEYLIDAIKLVANARLVIIGSGSLERKLKNKITESHLDDLIKIIPEVDKKTLYNYYKSCDILVLPSIEKSETYGLVQIEAMACGKPVISTEIGTGTTFINQHEKTGLVVPPKDSKALAESINRLIRDKSLRDSLGSNAKNRALSEFTSEKMVKRTYDLYLELLKDSL